MAQMLIRSLDDDVVEVLKRRASENRTSAEAEARRALREHTRPGLELWLARVKALREANGPQVGPDSAELVREARDELDAKWL